jgi:hypothetical protein
MAFYFLYSDDCWIYFYWISELIFVDSDCSVMNFCFNETWFSLSVYNYVWSCVIYSSSLVVFILNCYLSFEFYFWLDW